jgi:hypothetical protein
VMEVPSFELVWDFILGRKSETALLKDAGTSDWVALSVAMLQNAIERQHPGDLEAALAVIFRLRIHVSPAHRQLLVGLSDARWHHSHEDIIGLLAALRDESLVDVLVTATQWLPDYMAYDEDNRSLARKAIYALSELSGTRATEALRELSHSPHPRLSELAERKLKGRGDA